MTVAGASAVPAAAGALFGLRLAPAPATAVTASADPTFREGLLLRLRLRLLLQLRRGPTGDDGFGFVLLRLTATAQCSGCGRFLLPAVTAGWGQLRARRSSLVNL